MQKIHSFTILLLLFLTACGSSPPSNERPTEPAAVEATPTAIVLATPTPVPPPPTPTTKPPAPLESAAEPEDVATTEVVETTPEEVAPTLNDDMVLISAGPFTMGQNGGKPKNGPSATVDMPAFEIDRFEVTNADYALFAEATGYQTYAEKNGGRSWRAAPADKAAHPAVYITWNDAVSFCQWAGKRLPTELEWEKAARGDDGRIYPWGNEFDPNKGNFKERGIRGTTAVGSFPEGASPYGVEDMAGNVREWTQAYLLPYEGQAPDADPYFGEEFRIHRGGGWFDDEGSEVLTTYNRNAGPPDISANDDLGFRCAR